MRTSRTDKNVSANNLITIKTNNLNNNLINNNNNINNNNLINNNNNLINNNNNLINNNNNNLIKTNIIKLINKNINNNNIKLIDYFESTNKFNCRLNCDSRLYEYLIPFQIIINNSQITLLKIQTLLSKFIGIKNHHNFTLKRNYSDLTAIKNIINITVELKTISVK